MGLKSYTLCKAQRAELTDTPKGKCEACRPSCEERLKAGEQICEKKTVKLSHECYQVQNFKVLCGTIEMKNEIYCCAESNRKKSAGPCDVRMTKKEEKFGKQTRRRCHGQDFTNEARLMEFFLLSSITPTRCLIRIVTNHEICLFSKGV